MSINQNNTNVYLLKLAIEMLKIVDKGNEAITLPNKNRIQEILQSLLKHENITKYFLLKENLSFNYPTNKIMDIVNAYGQVPPEILFSNHFTNFEVQYDFEVDLVKFGKQLNTSIKRFALVKYPVGIFSIKESLKTTRNKEEVIKKAKEKNHILDDSKLHCYEKGKAGNVINNEWEIPTKNFLIIIEKLHSQLKIDKIELYTSTKDEQDKLKHLLLMIKINRTQKNIAVQSLTQLKNLIIGHYNFLAMTKILTIKNAVKKRVTLINCFKNVADNKINQFNNNSKKICSDLILKLKGKAKVAQSKKTGMLSSNKSDEVSDALESNRKKTKITDFSYKHFDEREFNSISFLKEKVNILAKRYIKNKLPLNAKSSSSKLNESNNIKIKSDKDKFVAFKLNNVNITAAKGINNININDIRSSKNFTINKKSVEIHFSNNSKLDRSTINDISHVFINNNDVTLYGPKIDPSKFLKFSYINMPNKLLSETSMSCPNLNKSWSKEYNGLILQIFHSTFIFESEEFDYLKMIYSRNKNYIEFNSPHDFLYFLKIKVDNKINQTVYETRSKLIELTKYENGVIYLEWNYQFLFNFDMLKHYKLDDITISFNIVPKQSFLDNNSNDINDINTKNLDSEKLFLTQFLYSHEIAYCDINKMVIERKLKQLFVNLKKDLRPNQDNKLIINIIEKNINENTMEDRCVRLPHKAFTVGSYLFYEQMIDSNFIRKYYESNTVSDIEKENLWKVSIDLKNNIYLREPKDSQLYITAGGHSNNLNLTKQKLIELLAKQGVTTEDFRCSYNNKIFKYIPLVQRENNQEFILSPEERNKEFITKVQGFEKYFCCKVLGVTQDEIIFKNEVTEEVITMSLNNQKLYKRKEIKVIDEDMFNIIDFKEISQNSVERNNENYENNYSWNITLNFINNLEKEIFMRYLKELRRSSSFKLNHESLNLERPINIKHLLSSLVGDDDNVSRCLKIFVEKIEFRHIFNLKNNSEFGINFKKGGEFFNLGADSSEDDFKIDFIENLTFENYQNSILINNSNIIQETKKLINRKIYVKSYPKLYQLKVEDFNKSEKIIKYKKKPNINEILNFDIKPDYDKSFVVEVRVKDHVTKKEIAFSSMVTFDQILSQSFMADYVVVPMYSNEQIDNYPSSTCFAMISIKLWITKYNENTPFDEYFDNHIKTLHRLKDEYDNVLNLGKFNPNINFTNMKNKIHIELKKSIKTLDNNEYKNKEKCETLMHILNRFCLKGVEEFKNSEFKNEEWKKCIFNLNSYEFKYLKKFYVNYRRNFFYRKFAESEWRLFINGLNQNNQKKSPQFEFYDIYRKLPYKNELLKLKTSGSKEWDQFTNLIYLGIPSNGRNTLWEKLLEIENLVEITKDRIKNNKLQIIEVEFIPQDNESPLDTNKRSIFEYLVNKSCYIYNINFSLIDNDLSELNVQEYETQLGEFTNIKIIRKIAKAFYLWAEYDIMTDKFTINNDSDKKFVYFYGLLPLIQKIIPITKEPFEAFWILVGLSQIYEVFYQSNPLFSNQNNFTKYTILVLKLILECNIKPVFNKFHELNFPIEFFIMNNISSLFSDTLHSDLFLRLMDIIIFESTFKTNNSDKYNLLRVVCTIYLTLMKLNEEKILLCKSVTELESVFFDLVKKSFNTEKFIEIFRDNLSSYYQLSGIFEKYFLINVNKATSWDIKRETLYKKINNYFSGIEKENQNYLKKYIESKEKTKITKILEDNISDSFIEIKKLYSTANFKEDTITNKKTKFILMITNVWDLLNYPKNTEYSIYYSFDDSEVPINRFNFDLIKLISGQKCVDGTFIKAISQEFSIQQLTEYLNIYIKQNNQVFNSYSIKIKQLDFLKPHKIKLESKDNSYESMNKSVIEIGIIKYSDTEVGEAEGELYNFLFSEPSYLFDIDLHNTIGESILPLGVDDKMSLYLNTRYNYFFSEISKIYGIKGRNAFLVNQFKLNTIRHKKDINSSKEYNSKVEDLFNTVMFKSCLMPTNESNSFFDAKEKINELIKKLFPVTNSIIFNWIKSGFSSFEEILFSVTFVDSSCVTIYDKLQLLFDISKMKNFVFFGIEKVSIAKLKELVYILYKRYMVYFTKNDVSRLIDYLIKKENLYTFRNVFLYNKAHKDEVFDILAGNDYVPTNSQFMKFNLSKKKENSILDLTKHFNRYDCFLKNMLNIQSIHPEMLSDVFLKYIVGSKNEYQGYLHDKLNQLVIQMDSENVRKVYIFDYDHEKNRLTYKNPLSFDLDDANFYEKALALELDSLELYNNENIDLDFNQFKKIFFKLPLIPDLLRATCSFSNTRAINFIKTFQNLYVKINVDETDYYFLFTRNKSKDFVEKKNVVIYTIEKELDSSYSLQMIVELITCAVPKQDINYNRLKYYLEKPKLMTYFIITEKDEEKIKFYDPLYSNLFIRDRSENVPNIMINIKFETIDGGCEVTETEVSWINKGFAKYKYSNFGKESYEWRKCGVKEAKNKASVQFTCFENKFEILRDRSELIVDDTNLNDLFNDL